MEKLLPRNFCRINCFYCFCKSKTIVFLFFIFLISQEIKSQNLVFATTVSDESYTTDSNLAIDSDLTTRARVRASSGIAIGIGAYSGHIELEFPTLLPANTTTYVKIETEDNLLDVLLGGELGGLLSDVLGVVILGNQEFTIEAKNTSTVVLDGNSQIDNDFAGPRLKVVIDDLNNAYLMITPSQPYNRIRITDRVGSLIGLGNTKDLWVYDAFYYDAPSVCGSATYTSFSGSGLTLDLLTLGGAGVQNPNHVIDNDLATYSRLSLGIIAVAGSIEQSVYFEGLSNSSDSFIVSLKVDPALLALGLANNVELIAYNGPNMVQTVSLSSLLNLDLLTALQGNQVAAIPFTPNQPVDRVTVRYNSLLNVSLTQSLDLYDIVRVPQSPTLDVLSQNVTICSGTSATLIANSNPTTLEIRWYDAEVGGNLIATTASGQPFVTPVINATTTFYVASGIISCPEESLRIPVVVTVNQSPTAADINITGNETDICAIQPVVLTPSSSVGSVFNWYLSNDYTQEITDGMMIGSVNYAIEANGVLTITGLNDVNSPYTFYVSVTNGTTSCRNLVGDLKEIQVSIIDATTPTTTNTTQEFCITDVATIAQLQVNESTIIWYDVPIGGTAIPTTTVLVDNGIYYASQIGANGCESSIRLSITVDLIDSATPTTLDATQEFCISDAATIAQLQVNESNVFWYDAATGGTALASTTLLVDNGVYYATQVGVNGCESSTRLMVTVDLNDTPAPTTTDTIQEFCITDLATVAQLQATGLNINWYDVPTGGTALAGTTLLVDNGIYYATQVGTNGCESSTRLMVTVDILSNSIANITPTNLQLCVGNSNTYTTTLGMSNYQWTVVGGVITSGGGVNDATVTVQWNATTGAEVSVTYDDALGCGGLAFGSFTQILDNCSDLVIEKSVDNSTPIPGETIHFTISVTNNGLSVFTNVEVNDILPSGYNFVSYTATSGSYSASNGMWLIPTIDQNEQVTMTMAVTVNSTGDYMNTATIVNSVPIDVDLNNNSDEQGVTIECFTIYNEFSPNGDGVNDYFEIDCIENYPNNKIEIYNRYGSIVYQKRSYNNEWSGVANVSGILNKGEVLSSGTYFYILTIDDVNFKKTGWIYIAK